MASKRRSKAIGTLVFWIFALVIFIIVLLTDYRFPYARGGGPRMSEEASDLLAAVCGMFSALAVWVSARRLINSTRA